MKRLSTTDFTALDERLDQEVHADRGVELFEVVRRLEPKIQQLRAQGVAFEKIVTLLNEQGLSISASTLRAHLKRITKVRGRGSRPRAPRAQPSMEVPDSPATPRLHPERTQRAPTPASPATKVPAASDSSKKDGSAPTSPTGHFVPAPDSERI